MEIKDESVQELSVHDYMYLRGAHRDIDVFIIITKLKAYNISYTLYAYNISYTL